MRACNGPPLPPGHGECHQGGGLTPAQVKRINQWGQTRRRAVERSWRGVCSPRTAIKLQCLDCCGEDERAITECGDRCCPLWRFRPFQRQQ